jgi:nucleoside-diphosphate-sugar epimerase
MKVVVTGATGNVGTSVVRALSADASVEQIVAVARRKPRQALDRSEFVRADVTSSDLVLLCMHGPAGPRGCIVTARDPQRDRSLRIRWPECRRRHAAARF